MCAFCSPEDKRPGLLSQTVAMYCVTPAYRKVKKKNVVCADHIAKRYFYLMRWNASWVYSLYYLYPFKATNPDIKMLFMDIKVLCSNYSKEFTQVLEFQDSHRRRLLAHYKGKKAKLEETVKELTQELQSIRSSQSYNQLPSSSALLDFGPENHRAFSPYSHPVSSQRPNVRPAESVDFASSTPQKKTNFTIAAPTRLSLISSPRERCLGHIPHKMNTTGSLRSTGGSLQPNIYHQLSQSASQMDRRGSWNFSSPGVSQLLSQTSASSQPSKVRQPITLTNILQRRH